VKNKELIANNTVLKEEIEDLKQDYDTI